MLPMRAWSGAAKAGAPAADEVGAGRLAAVASCAVSGGVRAVLGACACCGEDKVTVALQSRADVELCRDCLGGLAGQITVTSTPTLPVVDMAEAVAFYERAGFGVRLYTDDSGDGGDGFAFVDYDGESVFDLDAAPGMDPALNRAGCYLITRDADDWHARMRAAGLAVTDIADQPWGMHEFALTDPSGNHVRIGRSVDDDSNDCT